ncbi:MAG: hypothetical protein JWM32_2594 [Verrucomicrobia bacterium]|nr:hypothetical protein [Verrucomicrobiota bacterium]
MARFIKVLFLLASVCATAAVASPRILEVDIRVRSGIDDAEKKKRDREAAYGQDLNQHARVFLLGSVKEVIGQVKLPHAVDARDIARELKRVLLAQGFREVATGGKPEFVVTAEYGVGNLPNPFRDELVDKQNDTIKVVSNLSDSTVIGFNDYDAFRLDEKRTLADQQQLIIQVRAWKYPPPADPKAKPMMLWMTTMHVVDSPELDLNLLYPKLLASGAPFFDRHIEREREVVVETSVPVGTVTLGNPIVVEEGKARK